MSWGPKTREEAKTFRYRTWGGEPDGYPWQPERCAEEVPDGGRSVLQHQCWRKPGHGYEALRCKQHAAMENR